MRKVEKKIDLNTMLEDIKFELKMTDGLNELSISFRNVTDKILSKVVLKAKGYDYFSDPIRTGDDDFFLIEINQIELFPGKELLNYKINVLNEIKKIDIAQHYIVDVDKQKEIYKGAAFKIYYFEKFFPDHYKDKKELDMLKKFDSLATCYPENVEDGWICACGYLNQIQNDACKYCKIPKNDVFKYASKDAILEKIAIEEKEFYQRMQKQIMEKDRQENIRFFVFMIQFILGIALFIGLFALIIYVRAR